LVPGCSLIPSNDPTLLFVNAGMVQFKDVFSGVEKRDYSRAVSSQCCVRAGGKHNDLENVGYTARHHTFFEMLGNFSFGDYFKRDAIRYAWDFLTKELGIPAEKLWVTVHKDDHDTETIWLKEMKIDPERFSHCGDADNFWSMGDTGPCGPCTEIFYDHGDAIPGGPPGTPEEDGDRYVEVWNLVFMQYERHVDGSMTPLPKPSVDTGMGLERIAAVIQGVHSNYQIDLFQSLIKAIYCLLDKAPSQDELMEPDASFKVVADHIRSCSFLILDGVLPSNEGRGYVLRRIIRRAVRHGNKLGFKKPFFYKLVEALAKEMGDMYPRLVKHQGEIEKTLLREEKQFSETLEQGLKIFEHALQSLEGKAIPGEVAFKLYDTYGFPADLTADLARERGLTLDHDGFDRCMNMQRERSQASSRFALDDIQAINSKAKTKFLGYESLVTDGKVVEIYKNAVAVDALEEGERGALVFDRTPFYAESGGQVGDRGEIVEDHRQFTVDDTKKTGNAFLHCGLLEKGRIAVGDHITLRVDHYVRQNIKLNHSATHLLHAALRQVLGAQVQQKGSLVSDDRLRFDFSYAQQVTQAQLQEVERVVNQAIRANLAIVTEVMTPETAKESGAVALFGEKYGDKVRVLTMGDFSKELCGGTHADHTGDIGAFKIMSETGIAAGVRRIEAVTGAVAIAEIQASESALADLSNLLKTNPKKLTNKVAQLLANQKQLEKQLERANAKAASQAGSDLLSHVRKVAGVSLLVEKIENTNIKSMRELLDKLKDKLSSGVILLATVTDEGKVHLIAGITKDLTKQLNAGKLINHVAQQVGGKGGGRPDMAQAGGTDATHLAQALAGVDGWVKAQLV